MNASNSFAEFSLAVYASDSMPTSIMTRYYWNTCLLTYLVVDAEQKTNMSVQLGWSLCDGGCGVDGQSVALPQQCAQPRKASSQRGRTWRRQVSKNLSVHSLSRFVDHSLTHCHVQPAEGRNRSCNRYFLHCIKHKIENTFKHCIWNTSVKYFWLYSKNAKYKIVFFKCIRITK